MYWIYSSADEEIMARPIEPVVVRAQPSAIPYQLLRAMRPKQWVKNVFVFGAIAFSNDRLWMRPNQILLVIGAFLIFCACSGAIYLLNDLVDIEKDRAHPKKRNRPLASGLLFRPDLATYKSELCPPKPCDVTPVAGCSRPGWRGWHPRSAAVCPAPPGGSGR